jgi:hypothetical protein
MPDEPLIYVAVVNGRVSHIYSDLPLKFQVVAWESHDNQQSIRIDPEVGHSTEKDKLIKELFHLATDTPYDGGLLHRKS